MSDIVAPDRFLRDSSVTNGTTEWGRSVVVHMRVIGEKFTSIERNLPLSDEGRICLEIDCGTRLSRYNDQEYCSLHAPMVVPRMRGKILDD